MKRYFRTNLLILAAVLVMSLSLAPSARCAEVSDNLLNYLQLMRSDLNAVKMQLVNSIMKLSPSDADKFWPIYRNYENELGELALNRAELISGFVQSHQDGSFNDTTAKDMAKRWFKSQRARLDLLEKYHGKIQKALSPVQAGRFLQIENQIGLFVDITIASEMPVVGTPLK